MKIVPFLLLFLFVNYSFSQEVITGRSRPKKFDFKTAYNKNAPPDLYVDLNFFDDNDNNVLEPNETAYLNLTVHNRGNGPAQGLAVTLENEAVDQEINIPMRREVSFVFPGKSIDISIPITSKANIISQEHKVQIKLKDFYDYEIDPAYLVFNAYKKELKNISISRYKIPDFYVITGRIVDKILQQNSYFKTNLSIKNTGQVETGPISFQIEAVDPNLKIEIIKREMGNLDIGSNDNVTFAISNSKELDITNGVKVLVTATDEQFKKLLNKEEITISLDRSSGGSETFPPNVETFDYLSNQAYFDYSSKKYSNYVGKIHDIRKLKTSYTSNPHDIGIIIGIERYKSLTSSINSVNDALVFRSYAQKVLGLNKLKIYTNREFNDTTFNSLIFDDYAYAKEKITPDKTNFYIFYSGHTLATSSGDDLFLTSYDCNLNTLHNCSAKLSDIVNKLNEYNPNSINIIIESTLNGKTKATTASTQETIRPNSNGFSLEGFKNKTNTSKLNLILTSTSSQTPLTFQPSSTGLMSYFLFAGMQGNADANNNKIITTEELFKYVKNETEIASKKLDGYQIPQYIINKNLEIIEY